MENWPVNIVGLGLIIAGILFAYFLNFVGIIIGLIMIIGGIMALWMTYRRKKYRDVAGQTGRDAAHALPLREDVVVRARRACGSPGRAALREGSCTVEPESSYST